VASVDRLTPCLVIIIIILIIIIIIIIIAATPDFVFNFVFLTPGIFTTGV